MTSFVAANPTMRRRLTFGTIADGIICAPSLNHASRNVWHAETMTASSSAQAAPDTPASPSVPKLVMTEQDMPAYGMYEPEVEQAPAWVRIAVVIGGGAAAWGLVAAIAVAIIR